MNENALQAVQKKYAGYNLLMPAATEVQLNPFYKITVMEVPVDVSENSGDIFKVGMVKDGKGPDGKDIYVDSFSPAKPLLMKLAAAAGIQFDPEHTYGSKIGPNTYRAKAYGAMRMPDGTGKTHADEKVICLDDEEANYRLEAMDKSIKGIVDEKQAKAAAEMFKGKWIDSVNKWNKPCKAYVIDDSDRSKYIDRYVLVNMTLLRKSASEKAMTGAILRVIRALTGLKGQYTKRELSKPFAIPRVTFAPDYSDPEVKKLLLSQGMNSISSLFGSSPTVSLPEVIHDKEIFELESMGFTNNEEDRVSEAAEKQEDDIEHEFQEQITQEEYEGLPWNYNDAGYQCDECGEAISEKVYQYSVNKFGKALCLKHQKGRV